jgi:DNA primase
MFCKELIYNVDNAKDGTAVVVEGPIDAWRIGDGAVATFGVIYTQKQIKLLRERFKRVFIMYDSDAQPQAWKLADALSTFNMEVNVVTLKIGDPGSMTATEAREIRREIFGK